MAPIVQNLEPRLTGYLGMPYNGEQKHLLAVEISLAILATIAVALRFYSRSLVKARFWWDDFVILFALVHTLEIRRWDCQANESCAGVMLWIHCSRRDG